MFKIRSLIYYFITGIKSLPSIFVSIFLHFFMGFYIVITIFPKYFIIGIKYILGKDRVKIKKEIKKQNPKKVFFMLGLSSCVYLICVFMVSKWSVQQLKIQYLASTIINNTEDIIKEETINPPVDEPNNDNSENTADIPNNDTEIDNDIPISGNNSNQNTTTYYPNDYWDYINVPFISVNFNELLKKNSDTVGWIKIENTKVNYPVVQTTNNDYYLNHAFNKTKNASGWIYADFRADFVNFEKNTIIYGLNLTNRTMFGSLVETQKHYWYSNPNNRYIKISTPTANTVWAIFSTYTIEPTTDYLRTNFENHNYFDFLKNIKNRSIYNFDVDLTEDDKIITLSTCNDTGTKRIVVHAKMVTINYR